MQLMTKKLANAVETLIAPSDKIRKILEGYQVSCPVEVIPSGIHLEKYQLCIMTISNAILFREIGQIVLVNKCL